MLRRNTSKFVFIFLLTFALTYDIIFTKGVDVIASDIKKLREEIRTEWFGKISWFLGDIGEEVLITASNELAIPVVDKEGNEHYVVVTVKIPTDSRDGEPYDGYAAAQDYAMKCEERKAKAEEKERKDAERKAKKDK